MRYTVLLHPDESGGFSVTVPELDGCATQGGTFEEAVAMARDAIEGYLAVFADKGWEIPVEREPIIPITIELNAPVPEPAHAA
jgi:antitoxin HicB